MIQRRAAPTGVALPRFAITPAATAKLHEWADGLAAGTLRLWQLPDAIMRLYELGYEQGRVSRDEEVHALAVDRDRHWLLAQPANERQEYLLNRLDEAARLANRPDVDDVLNETWRLYVAGLNTIRQPIVAPMTTQNLKEVA